MKSYTFIVLALVSFWATACVNSSSRTSDNESAKDSLYLETAWTTDSLITPESVLWVAEEGFFYVSEIGDKEGAGAIAKINGEGKILTENWATGLEAPKGMGLYKDTLFVADLKKLVLIDTQTGNTIRKLEVPGAVFLNDITVGEDGTVYISDTREGKIYTYKAGQTNVYLQQAETKDANGLLIKDKTLWMLTAGGIYTCNLEDKSVHLFSNGVKGGDGIAFINDSSLIASRWAGEVFYVTGDGNARILLDTKQSGANTADLDYIKELGLLVIPTFKGQTVKAFQLKYE